MRQTVCAFTVAMLISATTYEMCHAAPSHRYRHPYIVVPLTRHYGYSPYWWPPGQYHWSPFGLERWGYWCEGAGSQRLSC